MRPKQLRRAKPCRWGCGGAVPRQRWVSEEIRPLQSLGACCSGNRRAWAHGRRKVLMVRNSKNSARRLSAEEESQAPSLRVCGTQAQGQPPETPPLGPGQGEGPASISQSALWAPCIPGGQSAVKKQIARPHPNPEPGSEATTSAISTNYPHDPDACASLRTTVGEPKLSIPTRPALRGADGSLLVPSKKAWGWGSGRGRLGGTVRG